MQKLYTTCITGNCFVFTPRCMDICNCVCSLFHRGILIQQNGTGIYRNLKFHMHDPIPIDIHKRFKVDLRMSNTLNTKPNGILM